jgi:hypothetical protein
LGGQKFTHRQRIMPNGHITRTARLSKKDFAGISEQHCFKIKTKCVNFDSKINRLDSFVSFSDSTALLRRLGAGRVAAARAALTPCDP